MVVEYKCDRRGECAYVVVWGLRKWHVEYKAVEKEKEIGYLRQQGH